VNLCSEAIQKYIRYRESKQLNGYLATMQSDWLASRTSAEEIMFLYFQRPHRIENTQTKRNEKEAQKRQNDRRS